MISELMYIISCFTTPSERIIKKRKKVGTYFTLTNAHEMFKKEISNLALLLFKFVLKLHKQVPTHVRMYLETIMFQY